jgi:outer membrane autotransporter protein
MSGIRQFTHKAGRNAGRAFLLTGTALGLSLLVQPATAAVSDCGAPVAGVVTCPAGTITTGVNYTVGADGLTLNIPADANVSNTDAPAVKITGSTGQVTVNAKGVTGNGAAGEGGLGVIATTTTGAITFDVEDVKTTALTYNGTANRTNDAVTALSDSGNISITGKQLSSVGTYSSAAQATSGSGDIVLNIDGASSTGVGGQTIGAFAYTNALPGGAVTIGGAVTATVNNVVATHGSGGVALIGRKDVNFTSGSITSTGGPNVSEYGSTFYGSGLLVRSYAGNIVGTSQTIATTGKRDYAASLTAAVGDIDFTSGVVSTTGDGAYGISATAGKTVKVTAATTTTQGSAVYENNANRLADAINVSGGTAMIVDSGTASTTGNGASAIYANGAGSISIKSGSATATGGSATLNGVARFANAISAQSTGGGVTIDSGTASTAGAGSWAIYASAANGAININSTNASATGNGSRAIYANGGGGVKIVSGTASTAGNYQNNTVDAIMALTFSKKANIDITSGTATTLGTWARGVYTWTNEGDIAIDSGVISTAGLWSQGILVDQDGNFDYADHAAAAGTGALSIKSGSIATLGDQSAGIATDFKGVTTINSGAISTKGWNGYGIVAFGGDDVTVHSGDITTLGFTASGIQVETPGLISITSDTISTASHGAAGVRALGGEGVTIVSGAISTKGDKAGVTGSPDRTASGIYAASAAGPVDITSGSITTSGFGAQGIRVTQTESALVYGSPHTPAGGPGTVKIVSDTIHTTGGDSVGIWVENTGKVTIDSGSITAENASGINVYGKDGVDITSDTVNGGYGGIFAYTQDGPLKIKSGDILVGDRGDMGIYAVSTTGTISIDAGTTRTTNLGFNGNYTADAIGASSNGGAITIKSVDASAVGTYASAVYGMSTGGSVTIDSGKARAASDKTLAIMGKGDVVTIRSQDAEITGAGAVAIQAVAGNGDATVTSGRAVTNGVGGKGLDIRASHDAIVTITGETSGDLNGAAISALHRSIVTVAAGGSVTSTSGVGLEFKTLTISGSPTTGVTAGYGADLTTSGYISGAPGARAVLFGAGDDTLTVLAGASFGGAIDAGLGQDTLTLKGAGQANAQTLGGVLGFETASVQSGQFTLTQDTNFGATTISGGKLITTGALTSDVTVGTGGTLQIGAGGTTGSLVGDLAIGGTVIFNRSDEYDYAGDITGTGELIKQGAQRLVLSGYYGFTGTTTVQGGTVRILHLPSTAEVQVDNGLLDLSGLTQTVTNLSGGSTGQISIQGGALTVNQSDTTTFSGAITGSGTFTMTGGGVIDLAGANTYTGDTTVGFGKLKVNGSVTSDVTVGSAGILGGSGTIAGDVLVQSGGIVGPGNSPGTLHVNGDFTFATGSVYQAEVLPTGEHDLIDVTGVTTIQSGVTVQVLAGGPTSQYQRLSQYGIVASAGGIVGKFAGVTSNLAFLTPTLTYTNTAVRLNLLRNDIRFASFATTTNQANTARAAEAQGLGSAVYDALVTQSAAGSVQGYDALDGQIHADVSTLLVSDAGRLREAVQNRASAPADAVGGWGDVLAGWNSLDAGAGAAGLKTKSSGLVVGGDTVLGSTRIGVAGAYNDGRASVVARGSQADSTTGQVAVYAASVFGPLKASVGGGYAWSSVDTVRAVSFPGAQDRVKGKYDAKTAQLFAEVSAPVTVGSVVVEPFASGAYLSVKSDDAVETGGFARLDVDGVKRELGVVDVGFKVKADVATAAGSVLRPHASIAWRMTTGDLVGETSNAFVGGVNRFVVTGAKYDANALALTLGADLFSGDRARFGVTYDAAYGDRYQAQAIRAGGSWKF